MSSTSKSETSKPPLEKLPELETTPGEKEEKNDWSSFVSRFDIKFQEDCASCKVIGAAVCYLCGMLMFQTVTKIPATNMPARITTGLFGASLFGMGTMRLFDEPTKWSAQQMSESRNEDVNSSVEQGTNENINS